MQIIFVKDLSERASQYVQIQRFKSRWPRALPVCQAINKDRQAAQQVGAPQEFISQN